jgi:elongation factor Ts
MTIKASDVKALRDRTGAGMMACKKAQTETGNDVEKAIDFLRKAGESKAAKAATRIAAEGRISVAANENSTQAVVLELNSETDFSAKNEDFITFSERLTAAVLANSPANVDALMALPNPFGEGSFESYRQQLISKIGENIHVRRFTKKTAGHAIGHYCHRDRIGVLVTLDQNNPELARNIALHVAAINPQAINSEGVPAELIEREREIYLEQTKQSGKSGEIAIKMVEGRINKYLREISLIDQPFVKNPEVTIGSMLKSAGAQVLEFLRYELGEGIDKKVVDFREEVMQQAKGKA